MSFIEELKENGIVVRSNGVFKTTYDYYGEQDTVYVKVEMNLGGALGSFAIAEFDVPLSESANIPSVTNTYIRNVIDCLKQEIPEWIKESTDELMESIRDYSKYCTVMYHIESHPDSDITKRANDWLVCNTIIDFSKYPYVKEWNVFYDRVHSFILCLEEFENYGGGEGYSYILNTPLYPDGVYLQACSILRKKHEEGYLSDEILDYMITGDL
jgi:hypothetical protein